jgi:arginine decarboxylase-like protein
MLSDKLIKAYNQRLPVLIFFMSIFAKYVNNITNNYIKERKKIWKKAVKSFG